MPALIITTSSNIASLDSKILANLCDGTFYIDVTPSIAIGAGFGTSGGVIGASVKIVNPYGVTIKDYPTSGYDIYPPMTSVVEVDIPTQANNFQYGQYTILVLLTDEDGTTYEVTKTVSICAPDSANKTRNYGSLSAQLNGVCTDGKVYIIADSVPTYNGAISNSQVNAFTLEYPTSSGLAILSTSVGSFSTTLFEGVYKFNGTICANYNYGDNVSVKVNYKVKREKNIRCLLDETCISAALSQLDAQTKADCSDAEKQATQQKIINALRLIKTIEVTANAGFDASDFIDELEDVLGCVCTCNCAEGTPIINNAPAKDFSITGCNVEKTTVGLTDTYVIDNYVYIVAVTGNGGVITITAPVLADCTQTQTITFNIAPLYAQIKNQIVNTTEYDFWASIINKSWDSLDIACIGVSQVLWDAYSYEQRTQAIINRLCIGGNCDAEISTNVVSNSAANVSVSWTNVEGVYEVAAYLDGVLSGTVLSPAASYTFVGAADGNLHEYKLISKCSNGSIGNLLDGTFNYYGCPAIANPTVSDANVENATCPYDLTALVGALPSGISAEWHNLNNTNDSSLVPDPTNASDGTYFVFAKNTDGCYSFGVQVILTCSSATNCSAPQTLLVEAISGGFRVRFQSAAFPPPLNSYTVKRRLTGDPDVGGSYTTIGTPTWNATVNRWEILDATGVDNTLYTYRAISNCTSTSPYQDYIFANLSCPAVTLTPAETEMDYSFTGVGGSVDKYEVKIYDSSGATLIHTDTILPAFSTPITGTFIYLTQDTTYLVRVRVWIGTYFKDCAFTSGTTTSAVPNITWEFGNDVGAGGRLRIFVNGGLVIDETSSNTGTLTAAIGDDVSVIVTSTVSGTAEIDISGPYTNSMSATHITTDDFTVAAGSYIIEAASLA